MIGGWETAPLEPEPKVAELGEAIEPEPADWLAEVPELDVELEVRPGCSLARTTARTSDKATAIETIVRCMRPERSMATSPPDIGVCV